MPVLCEKPAAVNARALQTMIDAARASKRLFMEAMKPPFYPLYTQLRAHLAADPIGEIGLVRAGCSIANVPATHPSFSMDIGGGALLDIGIYERSSRSTGSAKRSTCRPSDGSAQPVSTPSRA